MANSNLPCFGDKDFQHKSRGFRCKMALFPTPFRLLFQPAQTLIIWTGKMLSRFWQWSLQGFLFQWCITDIQFHHLGFWNFIFIIRIKKEKLYLKIIPYFSAWSYLCVCLIIILALAVNPVIPPQVLNSFSVQCYSLTNNVWYKKKKVSHIFTTDIVRKKKNTLPFF